MPVTEAEIVDLLAGITRVHLAIIRGLSENHPRSAENIILRVREEADLTEPDGSPTLAGLAARLGVGHPAPVIGAESRGRGT